MPMLTLVPVPDGTSPRDAAIPVLAAMRMLGARPLVFVGSGAAELATRAGLRLVDPNLGQTHVRAALHAFNQAPPRGVVTTFSMVTGWRAPWATAMLFVDVPFEAAVYQAANRNHTLPSLPVAVLHPEGNPPAHLVELADRTAEALP